MKTFPAILFTLLVFALSAQDPDSLSTAIQDKMRAKIMQQLFEQGIFDYQDKKLPSFKLVDLDGNGFDSNNLLGKPTLVNFWFTACAPCIEEIPLLNSIQQSYADEMNFIAVTFDSRNEIALFVNRIPFNFKQLVEAKEYLKKLDVKTYPRTLIVDENLVVRFIDELKPKNQDYSIFETELRSQIELVLKR